MHLPRQPDGTSIRLGGKRTRRFRQHRPVEIRFIGDGDHAIAERRRREFVPRHAKNFAQIGEQIAAAIAAYADDVRSHAFPAEANTTHVDPEVVAKAELLYSGEVEE